MPNWKKLIVSGSDAVLNSATASAFLSTTGSNAIGFIGTASQASTASYAIGYSRVVASASIDNAPVEIPFAFIASSFLLSGGAYLNRASASFISLDPGTYQIYLDIATQSGGLYTWITSNPTPPMSTNPTLDQDRIPGSVIRTYPASPFNRAIINTNKFTINSTTQYYIIFQGAGATSSPTTLTIIPTGGSNHTRQYIIYKYDT